MEVSYGEEVIKFIATFHSQYGAVQFLKKSKKNNIDCKLAPVPRSLSSSCGTCAHYTHSQWDPGFEIVDLEAVYKESENGYELLFSSDD